MKTFKNIVAIAALCTIGSMHTKQTGTKKAAQPIITQPTRPVIQQPTKQIPKELPQLYPSQAQYFLNKIKELESTGIETYKMIDEHFAQMSLEEQKTIIEASEDMFANVEEQAEKTHQRYEKSLKNSINSSDKTAQPTEKTTNINQPYMVTEKNKQLMENNLGIAAKIAFGKIIDESIQYNMGFGDNDMRYICEQIDSLLRKAHQDYIQLGNTNEEQIVNAKMAMDIAEQKIIAQLSQLKSSLLRKLSDYILKSKYSYDKRIENIRKSLPTQS